MSIELDTSFDARPGEAVEVASGIVRITADNSGPFTFYGTNSYLVGTDRLVVIDPGPDDDRHLDTLLAAIAGRTVEAILVTHTHLDHTGLTDRLKSAVGAPVLAEGPHRSARPLHVGETNGLEGAGDMSFRPDRAVADGEILAFDAGRFEAIATPGHAANHMAYALPGRGILFSGDHVMGWSTTIVAPPEGSMRDYMRSLDRLMGRSETLYLPGHGGPVDAPQPLLRGLKAHRLMREAAILERLSAGDETVPQIVASIYRKTDPRLHGAAGLSVLAHLEGLVEGGQVQSDSPPTVGARFRRV
jgi:glyoxylase-like metal-dependent hydrolase (beta-lactamase superfamily II)